MTPSPNEYAKYDATGTRIIEQLIKDGWVRVEVDFKGRDINDFFEMKKWCEDNISKVGEDWINQSLWCFLFRDTNKALMFKLANV